MLSEQHLPINNVFMRAGSIENSIQNIICCSMLPTSPSPSPFLCSYMYRPLHPSLSYSLFLPQGADTPPPIQAQRRQVELR